jgi:hypothetical protein
MVEVGYFDVVDRRREKQEARDRDEYLIASGQADPQYIAQRNGLFSALDPSQVQLVQRRAAVRIA